MQRTFCGSRETLQKLIVQRDRSRPWCSENRKQSSTRQFGDRSDPFYHRRRLTIQRIPQTAVWGSFKSSLQRRVHIEPLESPTRQCGDPFKSFLDADSLFTSGAL